MSGEMKFLDFPHSEYKARIEKARENMHEKKLDVLLLTEKANLIYFSGYRTVLYISKFRPFICVLPRDRDPVMVVPDLEEALCRKTSWIDDVRAWGSTAKIANPITLTKETLSELNLERGRIGMEFGLGCRLGMTWIEFERLRNEMPEAEFVNCSDLIWRVRSVKSEEEIRRIEKACEITDKAVEAAWSILHEGVTETELDRAIKRTIVEEGGDGLAFGVVRSGRHRLDMLNAYPSDYKIQTGDLVALDLGTTYRGYNSDMMRTAIVGKPMAEQKKAYKASLRAQTEAREAIEPGVKCSEIDRIATERIIEQGYGEWLLHRTGHGIGLEAHELPSLAPTDNTELEPGMVVTVEPGIYPFEIGAFTVEDVVLVTKDGHKELTKADRELVVKD